MMMEVAGGVIIGLAVGAGFAAAIYSFVIDENVFGMFLLVASLGAALWIVLS